MGPQCCGGPGFPGVRDRLAEFFPLLLVGVVLLVFQLSRSDALTLPFQPLPEPTPTLVSDRPTSVPTSLGPRIPALAPGLCSLAEPRFVRGIATLRSALGAIMGDPLECERVVGGDGDTQQKTTTGLAYYRKQLNIACFTTGWEHWGLVDRGLVHWAGPTVDPPAEAVVIQNPHN
jgi:hypothetical protein